MREWCAGLAIGSCVVLGSWICKLYYRQNGEMPTLLFAPTDRNHAILERCRRLGKEKYVPFWYAFNGHIQTLIALFPTKKSSKILYRRHWIDLDDGGIVSLDWAFPDNAQSDASYEAILDNTKPVILILPGLGGGRSDFYVRDTVSTMLRAKWQCAVLNYRGCAGTPLKTPELFSMASTKDLRFVIKKLATKYQLGKMCTFVACGFSMGSNLLVKYAGEEKDATALHAAISIGNPYDLAKCKRDFTKSWLKLNTYDRVFLENLKHILFKRNNGALLFANHPRIDIGAVKKAETLAAFDSLFTNHIYNYKDNAEYYHDSSCNRFIQDVSIPLLCLSALDDPICTSDAIPIKAVDTNPNLILCVTQHGGHLGFVENSASQQSEKSAWSSKIVADFAESIDSLRLV